MDNPTSSAPITVLAVGGTGESYSGDARGRVSGLLSAVTDALDDRFDARWVGYPASYGPATHTDGMSFADSVAEGAGNLATAMAATTGPVVLVGYSQGAVVIRRWLTVVGPAAEARLRERVLAVGLVADPHQPPGVVDGCAGWGVAGPGPDLPSGLPVYWVGAAKDMICNAGSDSLLRDVADLTAVMSLTAPRLWVRQMWATLRANAFQNARRTRVAPSQWRRDPARLGAAWREVAGYLPVALGWHGIRLDNADGGRHTSYAAEPYRANSVTDPTTTGCQSMARWIQVQATFTATTPRSAPV